MKTLNLNRCSFLASALEYIQNHPGCNKRQLITAITPRNCYGIIPNKTYSYRNAALNNLIHAGLVRDELVSCNRYSLATVNSELRAS